MPFAGAVLEQMIFGTMDQVEASQQAEQLRDALAGIQDSDDIQSATLAEVLEKVDGQALAVQNRVHHYNLWVYPPSLFR